MNTAVHSGTYGTHIDTLLASLGLSQNTTLASRLKPKAAQPRESVDSPTTSGEHRRIHADPWRHTEIQRLLERTMTSQFAVDEESPELQRLAESAPQIALFFEEVITALEYLQGEDKSADNIKLPGLDSLEAIGVLISAEIIGQEIGDMAFMGAMNLREAADHLARRMEVGRHSEIVALCDAAMHRVHSLLIPIDNALCRIQGLPAPHRKPHFLKFSLQTRWAYSKLRREIGSGDAEPAGEQLEISLTNSVQRFRDLRTNPVYPHLRLDDRLQIRGLCHRIDRWLQSEAPENFTEGLNLWRDLVSFLRLLASINCRQELEVYDFEVASQALRGLQKSPLDREIPFAVKQDLQTLLGRNDEIDGLLLDRSPSNSETWSSALHHLCRDLAHVA